MKLPDEFETLIENAVRESTSMKQMKSCVKAIHELMACGKPTSNDFVSLQMENQALRQRLNTLEAIVLRGQQ